MRQHDAAAAQPAPTLGRAQLMKKDLLAASAALDSFNLEWWYAKEAWVEARRPYTEALKECVRDCRLSETEDSLHAVQCAKAACAAFATGMLGARLKCEVKLKSRAADEAAEAWMEAEMAARATELPLFADYEEAARAVATRCWAHAEYSEASDAALLREGCTQTTRRLAERCTLHANAEGWVNAARQCAMSKAALDARIADEADAVDCPDHRVSGP